MKVNGQLLEPRADASALFEPADALLDHRTLAIRLFVERHRGDPIAPSDCLCEESPEKRDAA